MRLGQQVTRGGFAGFAGTAVMTMAMTILKKVGMEPGQLEPEEVTENLEEALRVRQLLPERAFEVSWVMLHFGYGCASGTVYTFARENSGLDNRSPVVGSIFGVLLWAIGYCGWLPWFGLYPPPTRVSRRKVVANILVHVTYGVATAVAHRMLRSK